jgi:hypothetical protein
MPELCCAKVRATASQTARCSVRPHRRIFPFSECPNSIPTDTNPVPQHNTVAEEINPNDCATTRTGKVLGTRRE